MATCGTPSTDWVPSVLTVTMVARSTWARDSPSRHTSHILLQPLRTRFIRSCSGLAFSPVMFEAHYTAEGSASDTPSWAPWLAQTLAEAYPLTSQSSANGEIEKVIAMESSSDEEGDDGSSGTSRHAALQAREKEIHWQSMTEDEIPSFVAAVQKEWSEWEKWSQSDRERSRHTWCSNLEYVTDGSLLRRASVQRQEWSSPGHYSPGTPRSWPRQAST